MLEFESDKDYILGKNVTKSNKMMFIEKQIETLNQQVRCLEIALQDSETIVVKLLSERDALLKKNIGEYFE